MADFETQDVCFGLESPLSDLSSSPTGSIVSYSWNFGDGRTSTDQNNLHQYAAPGFYQVSLTVTTDSGCVNTLVRPNALQVYAPPPASFLDNAVLASDIYPIVNFTNQTGTLGTYSWDFGDGALSTEYSPTHEYASIGIYEVQMIAIDLNGCVDTLLRSIEIRPTSNVYIPNSFTPNGDLKNDLFQVYTYNVVSVNSQIFDRWGLEIFTWDGVSGGWDGTIEGQPVQNDVYVYRIVTTDVNNKREVHVGHVSLVR
jgi:gliding motility-associated-like protein